MKIEDLKIGDEVFVKGVVSDKTFNIHGNKKFKIRTTPFEDVNGFIAKNKLILPNQPKPEVPQFVADWYEKNKEDFESVLFRIGWEYHEFEGICKGSEFGKWLERSKKPFQTLINMHQFGYTVQKEKLYTVEIPNPNVIGNEHTVLMKNGFGQIVMLRVYGDDWKTDKSYQLTEAEIRKDFDWAWQRKKEVEY